MAVYVDGGGTSGRSRPVTTPATWKRRHTTSTTKRPTANPPRGPQGAASPALRIVKRPGSSGAGYRGSGAGVRGSVGAAGAGGGTTPKPSAATKPVTIKAPPMPGSINPNIYGGVYKQMDNLAKEYARLKFTYTPDHFKYDDWEGRGAADAQGTARAEAELAGKQPAWANQRNQVVGNYGQSMAAMAAAEQAAAGSIARQGSLESGKLFNMMANTGMDAGQGAMEEMFGLNNVYAEQAMANARDFALQRGQAALSRAGELGSIDAEETGAKNARYARAMEIADALAEQSFNRYSTMRGQASAEFGDFENRRYQTANDAYNSGLNSINSRMNLLGERAGLMGDTWERTYNQAMTRYSNAYTAYQDRLNFAENARRYGLEYARSMAADAFNRQVSEQGYALDKKSLEAQLKQLETQALGLDGYGGLPR